MKPYSPLFEDAINTPEMGAHFKNELLFDFKIE